MPSAHPVALHMTKQSQLNGFLAKYSPQASKLAKAVLAKMRKRLPGAVQLVYDNYNALVIGFGPTERPSEAILSLVVFPRYVSICFLQGGPALPDPKGLLLGSGKLVRHLNLQAAEQFDNPAVQDLIKIALKKAKTPIDSKSKGCLIIRSISAKQRPRR
jgi:hypothetical protein